MTEERHGGKSRKQMYVTTIVKAVADELMLARAVFADGGWLEINAAADLDVDLVN